MRRRPSFWQVVAVGVVVVLGVVYLFPFYWMVVTALKPLREFYQFPPTLLLSFLRRYCRFTRP